MFALPQRDGSGGEWSSFQFWQTRRASSRHASISYLEAHVATPHAFLAANQHVINVNKTEYPYQRNRIGGGQNASSFEGVAAERGLL